VVTFLGWGWGALAILIPVVSGLFTFASRRVIGQFNYTLSRREHGLRISRGLTSLTSQSLPPRRVQAAQITQSPIWRGLGLYRLDIAVIGWGGITNDENDTGVSTILLPAGNIDQVRAALGAIWPRTSFETIELQRPPQRARWRHPFAAPFMRWGHDDQLTVTRHGWLVRTWHLVPHARTQSVQITQGPFSRRLRLAELEFHTAGGTVQARARGLDADLVRGLQADLLARVHHLPELDLSEPTPPPRPSESLGDPGLRRDDDGELNQTLPEPVQGSAVARQTPPEAVEGSAVARQTPPEAVEGSATATTTVPGPVDSLRRGDAGDWPQTVGPDAFRADQADATISSTE
jgi:putative membrane protein